MALSFRNLCNGSCAWEQIDGAQMGFSHQHSAPCLSNTNENELPAPGAERGRKFHPAPAAALARGLNQCCCVRAVLINSLFPRISPPEPSSEINEVSGFMSGEQSC